MAGRLSKFLRPNPSWLWYCRLWWVAIFAVFLILFNFAKTCDEYAPPNSHLGNVAIFSRDHDRHAELDRGKAVEFGLEQLAGSIKFVFLATAALLGYLSKTLLEPLLKKDLDVTYSNTTLALLWHSSVGCCFSFVYGFLGFTYFSYLPVDKCFSPFEEIGIASVCQQLTFLAAAILMIASIRVMWKERLSTNGKSQEQSTL